MAKKFKYSLFIFRRDFRLHDNTGLIYALKNSEKVICAFIFTPRQIDKNPYRSDHCLQFMIESLEDLQKQLKAKDGRLYLFWGKPEEVVLKCVQNLKIDAVVVNQDYTPYSIRRDKKIESVCKSNKVNFYLAEDLLLHEVCDTLKKDRKPYTVFTPYYKNASKLAVLEPVSNSGRNYYQAPISFAKDNSLFKKISNKEFKQAKGGRSEALKILKGLGRFSKYDTEKDFPGKNGTTHLSAHLKFNTCSPREVYYEIVKRLSKHSDLIRSLYWRDFFTSIAFHFPHVFEGAFRSKYDSLKWKNNKISFKKWCEGKTGFPIIDAGMREMNQTGYMHNRVRLIVSSFLVKDLHINWQWGEKYFAQTLIDYDPAVNNGNWQWVASTGCDAQPYFRIFNPWSQAFKFDPECKYIKQWVKELKDFEANVIHEWYLEKHHQKCLIYPAPIINHSKEVKKTIESYKKAYLIKK